MDKNKKLLVLVFLVLSLLVGAIYTYEHYQSNRIHQETLELIEKRKQQEKEMIANYMKNYSSVYCCDLATADSGIEKIKAIKKWEIVNKDGHLFFDVKINSLDDKGFPVSSIWNFYIEDDNKEKMCIKYIMKTD